MDLKNHAYLVVSKMQDFEKENTQVFHYPRSNIFTSAILDKNNNPVYNPAITGTYNFYTYGSIFSIDAYDHLKDIQLWKDYGTGPTDKTTKEMRTKVGDWRLGAFIQNNFDKLKSLETKMGRESFSYEELQDIKNKGIDNYGK